jgi:hypothetical protein
MQSRHYQWWRRRWLWWHSRTLLANALAQGPATQAAYIAEMRRAYEAYGDFTHNEMALIFGRVTRGMQKLHRHPCAFEFAQRAKRALREQGLRLQEEVSQFL